MREVATPANIEAEQAVLGAIFVNGCIPSHLDIAADEFYRDAHRRIFIKMQALHGRGVPIDYVTLSTELGDQLDAVGGPVYLARLIDCVPRSTNVEYYAGIVQQCGFQRRAAQELAAVRDLILADPDAINNGLPQRHAERWAEITAKAAPKVARAFTMRELAEHQFPARRVVLSRHGAPLIENGHLCEIHAPRGTGKTLFMRSLALIAATGTSAMGFEAPEPVPVCYIDGEMPGRQIQKRDPQLCFALNVQETDNLTTVAADWQDDPMPRLDTPRGQAFIAPFIEAAHFIVLDNRGCLFDPESEKDPVAWQPAQDWLFSLRRRGKAVVVVRHSNRQGGARGHSKSEDPIDLSIKLSRPESYTARDGARFKVEFDKSRYVHGAAVDEFVVSLTTAGWDVEGATQTTSKVQQALLDYLRAATGANEPPKSATAAIAAAHVQKKAGLEAWGALLREKLITKQKHKGGGFVLADHDAK